MQLDGAKPVFEKKVATVLSHFGSMIGESRTRSLTLDCLLLFGHETEAGLLRHQAWTMENTSDVIGAGRLATVAMGTDCQAHDSMDLWFGHFSLKKTQKKRHMNITAIILFLKWHDVYSHDRSFPVRSRHSGHAPFLFQDSILVGQS